MPGLCNSASSPVWCIFSFRVKTDIMFVFNMSVFNGNRSSIWSHRQNNAQPHTLPLMWQRSRLSRQSYSLIKRWNRFAILHAKQSVDKAICLSFMSPGGRHTLPNSYTGSLGLRWRLCVCVCVCVSTYVPIMYIHTWMRICIVLDLLSVFYDGVCLCLAQSAYVFVCDSECVYRGKMPLAFFFFFSFSIFRLTKWWLYPFWIKRRPSY